MYRVIILTLLSSLNSFASTDDCRAFTIKGSNSFGHFNGQIQILQNQKAYRLVNYDSKYENKFNVQELWEGKIDASKGIIIFEVKNHNFLSQVGNQTVTKEEYQKIDTLTYSLSALNTLPNQSCQTILDVENKREKNEIKQGLKNPLLIRFAKLAFINKVIKWFQEQPILDPYRNDPDFQNKKFYTINDLTDKVFYEQNPLTLRIRNSNLNEFTLKEAVLRNSAYAHSIEEKIKYFDENTQKYNINELGMFSYIIGDDLYADGDSSLWTAMYIASQGSKYELTKDPQALLNLKKSIQGLITLVNICPDQTSFARSVMPLSDHLKVDSNWVRGTGKYQNMMWLPGGNNDMIKGLFLGFIWAYKVLPESDPQWQEIKQIINRLENVKLKRVNAFNKIYQKALKTLYCKDADAYSSYLNTFLRTDNLADLLDLDRPFYVDGITDWSGTNLNMVGSYALLLMSQEIEKIENRFKIENPYNEDQWSTEQGMNAKWISKKAKKNLLEVYEAMKYAKRDYLCLMAYSTNKEKLGKMPDQCWLSLIETPMELPIEQLSFNRELEKDFIFSAIPELPWKSVLHRQDPVDHLMSNKNFPKFEGDGFSSQQMWKEGNFGYSGGKSHDKHMPRVDVLFSYWTYQYFMNLK